MAVIPEEMYTKSTIEKEKTKKSFAFDEDFFRRWVQPRRCDSRLNRWSRGWQNGIHGGNFVSPLVFVLFCENTKNGQRMANGYVRRWAVYGWLDDHFFEVEKQMSRLLTLDASFEQFHNFAGFFSSVGVASSHSISPILLWQLQRHISTALIT